MTHFTHRIVGAHFRPPSKGILTVLPYGQPLVLRAEPTNDFDSNAIQVILLTASLPNTAKMHKWLDIACQPFGWLAEDIFDLESIHLGYIPREEAAQLRRANIVRVGEDLACAFIAGDTPSIEFSVDAAAMREAAQNQA